MSEFNKNPEEVDVDDFERGLRRGTLLKERVFKLGRAVALAAILFGAGTGVRRVMNADWGTEVAGEHNGSLDHFQKDQLRDKYADDFESAEEVSPEVVIDFFIEVEQFANVFKTGPLAGVRAESAKLELKSLIARSLELKKESKGEEVYDSLYLLLKNRIANEYFLNEEASLMTNLLAKNAFFEGSGMGNCSAFAKTFGLMLYGTFYEEIKKGEVEVYFEHLDISNRDSSHTRIILRDGDKYHEFEFTIEPGFHRVSSREDFDPESRTLSSFRDMYKMLIEGYESSYSGGGGVSTGDPFVLPDPKRSERVPDENKMSVKVLLAEVEGMDSVHDPFGDVNLAKLLDLGDEFRKHRLRSMSVDDEIWNRDMPRKFGDEDLSLAYVNFVSKVRSLISRVDSEFEGEFDVYRYKAHFLWMIADYDESIISYKKAVEFSDDSDYQLADVFHYLNVKELSLDFYHKVLDAEVKNPEGYRLSVIKVARAYAGQGEYEGAAYIYDFLNKKAPVGHRSIYAIDFYYWAYGYYVLDMRVGGKANFEWTLETLNIGIELNEEGEIEDPRLLQLKKMIEAQM
ncbi:hypothetical protein JKY72_02680 [Candidatus Gracilibacteria bacterium]|nr:hypothetical protein [Candidatus Gracilibacteria bacterium]